MRPVLLSMICVLVATSPASSRAQSASDTAAVSSPSYAVPFGVGERGTYEVHFGKLKVGKGTMEVLGVEDVRGRPAWHTRFRIRGKGMPNVSGRGHGDLHVIARAAVPKKLTKEQKHILEELARTMPSQADDGSGDEEKPFFERVKGMFT